MQIAYFTATLALDFLLNLSQVKTPFMEPLLDVMPMKDSKTSRIDGYDRKILELLAADGRMPVTELASRIGLSKTPCAGRLKRLVDEGFIEGFRAVLSPQKLGLDHVAFAEVTLSDTRELALAEFNKAVSKIREVEECHMIAGRFDYLLKVRTPNIRRYREVLGEKISSLPHVASTSTSVAMQSVKEK